MRWTDLREYVDRLRSLGELVDVRGAHWDTELGVISELMIERGGPAVLFDSIPDYPEGFRVLANVEVNPSRLAITFGLNPDQSLEALAADWAHESRDYTPIPPAVQATGPVMENVQTGDDVNLFAFPTPKWHEDDGNRYIGTGVCVIQKDPDTGFVNAGQYRVAVHDEKTAIVFMEPNRHGDVIRRKHWDCGEKAPVLISCGQDPILTAIAGSIGLYCPDGVSELEVAGHFQGSPYPVVVSPRTGLPMPATAEIDTGGPLRRVDGLLTYRADSLIINACRPYEWKDEFPRVNVNSREIRTNVEEKWKHLFGGKPA